MCINDDVLNIYFIPILSLQKDLTMNQPFKIRKNKSQKDMKLTQDLQTRPGTNMNQHTVHNTVIQFQARSSFKNGALQPLKSKMNIVQNQVKKGEKEKRLDFTQPLNLRKIMNNGAKNDFRYDNPNGSQNLALNKGNIKDKQNRPCSMNDLKYNNTLKIKPSSFYNTEKYDSLNIFPSIIKNNRQLQSKLQKIDEQLKISKNKSYKYLSQGINKPSSRLIKQHNKIKTENEEQDPNKQNYSFRKSLLNELLERNKVVLFDNKVQTCSKPNMDDKFGQLSIIESKVSQLDENLQTPLPFNKQISIFNADCSTIKYKRGNQSSFISNQAINDFIKPQEEVTLPSLQEKTHVQKKKRLQIDKIRKKFPENFFK